MAEPVVIGLEGGSSRTSNPAMAHMMVAVQASLDLIPTPAAPTIAPINLQSVDLSISSRSGDTRFRGSLTFGSLLGDTTTLGADYTRGESGEGVALSSTYTPSTLIESIRTSPRWRNSEAPTSAFAVHAMASSAILQLTDSSQRIDMAALRSALAVRASLVTAGVISLKTGKNGTDDALDAKERQAASSTAAPGMPDPDDNPRWSKKQSLNAKQKEALKGVPLRGRNPGNVVGEAGRVEVDTELLGGKRAAREFFKQKTGVEVPEVVEGRHPVVKDGVEYAYRVSRDSGFSKIDISDAVSTPGTRILEKITFK